MAIRADCADRAGCNTQFALEAWVIVDGGGIGGYVGIDQNGSEQDEVSEFGVNYVPMNPHMAESGGDCDRLVRDDPGFARETIHFHREAHAGVDGANTVFV